MLALILAGCGGNGGEDSVAVSFQPQIPAQTSEVNKAALLDATVGTIRQRALLYGLDVPEITVSPDFTITIEAEGIDQATATQLLGERALFEFKRPVTDAQGVVACVDANGDRFGVPPDNVNPDAASRSFARCFSLDKVGDPEWAAAKAASGGELTMESVQPNGWGQEGDALVIRFNDEGAAVLEALTTELTRYPLGLFLDGTLIAAPRISRTVDDGEATISGFGEENARLRAAQLNAGPLAVELTAVAGTPAP